jgi:hypothetical protein
MRAIDLASQRERNRDGVGGRRSRVFAAIEVVELWRWQRLGDGAGAATSVGEARLTGLLARFVVQPAASRQAGSACRLPRVEPRRRRRVD